MYISPVVRFVFVMVFISVVLTVSLVNTGVGLAIGGGIWIFVVAGFGTYLYFRMLRSGPEDPDD
ncbi:hypothetical protein [Rubrobacter indicoceani]|uniref:hypothetical protein n=1 Tax=Rubrobacter indicoceani TaxID=2051957 RepID=UPI000E5B6888|nr:hypothetical protein [Rubrobacter indicoceani]